MTDWTSCTVPTFPQTSVLQLEGREIDVFTLVVQQGGLETTVPFLSEPIPHW